MSEFPYAWRPKLIDQDIRGGEGREGFVENPPCMEKKTKTKKTKKKKRKKIVDM